MNRISWIQVGVFAAIVLVTFMCGVTILPFLFGGYGGGGMMGPGMMGGGWPGGFSGGMFGWPFMLMGLLFPLALLVLVVLGVVWLVRTTGRAPSGVVSLPQACPNCGKPVAGDWRHCPQCGEELQSPE